MQQAIRFALAGVLNTGFSYGVFAVLLHAGAGAMPALIGTTVASLLFNFQTSRQLVFQQGRPGQKWRFLILYAGLIFMNWLALRIMASAGIAEIAGQAIIILPVAILSFAGQRRFVFKGADCT